MAYRVVSLFALCMSIAGWSTNEQNTGFYKGIGKSGLEEAARLAGIDTGIDIEQVASQIAASRVIIEIGSGYGRAAPFIRNHMAQNAYLYMVEKVV